MVGSEFIDFLSRFNIVGYVGVQDFADKLNYRWIPMILTLCTLIVTVKQYFFKAIACYMPTTIGGNGLDNYVENFCWIHGTYAIDIGSDVSSNNENWNVIDKDNRISYYQWLPFMLGLQTILFVLPQTIWNLFTYNRTGTDLEKLVNLALEASNKFGEERRKLVNHIVCVLDNLMYLHRDYRTSKLASLRRRLASICFLLVPSKRLGTWVFVCYFIIKTLSFANVVGQLYLMEKFLQMGNNYSHYGYDVLKDLINGRDWQKTLIFPRVTFCRPQLKNLASDNAIFAQCVLPVNMLNEKIFIFLWWLFVIVSIITVFSMIRWLITVNASGRKKRFFRRLLKLANRYNKLNDKADLNRFLKQFLRRDGHFLIRMISLNVGDLIATEITSGLFELYKEKYVDVEFLPPLPHNNKSIIVNTVNTFNRKPKLIIEHQGSLEGRTSISRSSVSSAREVLVKEDMV